MAVAAPCLPWQATGPAEAATLRAPHEVRFDQSDNIYMLE
jgi:hypothetical protein